MEGGRGARCSWKLVSCELKKKGKSERDECLLMERITRERWYGWKVVGRGGQTRREWNGKMKSDKREVVWMESGRERREETRGAWIERKERKNEER